MNRSLQIFSQFLNRDFYIQLKSLKDYIISYGFFVPLSSCITFGYIIPKTTLSTAALPNELILTGSLVLQFIVLPVSFNLGFLIDLQNDKFIEYKLSLLKPHWVVLEQIIFSALLLTMVLLPFFAVSKLFLGSFFNTANLSTLKLILMILVGSLAGSSYVVMSFVAMGDTQYVSSWFRRCNFPMFMFGGIWTTWAAVYNFSPAIGYLDLLNPLVYISEGLRSAIIGPTGFIPFWICISVLSCFSIIFYLISLFFFKKLTDHV